MIRIGKAAAVIVLLWASSTAVAAVDASLDRTRVALGDTLRLTVSATEDDEALSSVDLSMLQRDFEVLQRSTRSNTSFVNGQRNHSRQLILEITPLRTGTLAVPAFQVGASSTRPIQVTVSEPTAIDPGAEQILFGAELDRDSVYVQGQVILTVRLQQAVNLDSRSISELELPGTFVIPLEQKSFQRNSNGKPWLVHEVRYAIFPEQSGTLQIPSLMFSARESRPRRSLFDSGSGKRIRMHTQPLTIEVLPRPEQYPASATWLPARQLSIEEEWSEDPANLQAGSSITRTLRLSGEGLQGAQLPPVTLPASPGVKFYPDQPGIQDAEISSGLLGTRVDSTAIVPTASGTLTLPEIRIPWWDTEAGQLRHAILPARTLQVAPLKTEQFGAATPGMPDSTALAPPAASASDLRPWQLATVICGLGWLFTLVLWRRGRTNPVIARPEQGDSRSRREAYKNLLAACAADQPGQARQWFIRWAASISEDSGVSSLEDAAAVFDDDALRAELQQLDAILYSAHPGNWQGQNLAARAKALNSRGRISSGEPDELPALYPGTS